MHGRCQWRYDLEPYGLEEIHDKMELEFEGSSRVWRKNNRYRLLEIEGNGKKIAVISDNFIIDGKKADPLHDKFIRVSK